MAAQSPTPSSPDPRKREFLPPNGDGTVERSARVVVEEMRFLRLVQRERSPQPSVRRWNVIHASVRCDLAKQQSSRRSHRFAGSTMLSSPWTENDMRRDVAADDLPRSSRKHIDEVLRMYGSYAGTQVESLSQREKPWLEARGTLLPQ